MAAPKTKNIEDLHGDWFINKELSDSPESILQAQGIGYLTRKGVSLATIHLHLKQYEAAIESPSSETISVVCIESTQTASGLKSTKEIRYLDNKLRDHQDWLFGKVMVQSKWVDLKDIQDTGLKHGWLIEGGGKNLLLSRAVSQGNGWTATQVWGFQQIEGERRFCIRVVVVSKDNLKAQARFIYDYRLE